MEIPKIPKTIQNAMIIGGIAAFSSLSATAVPSVQNVYTGFLAGAMAMLVELAYCNGIMPRAKKGSAKTFFF